MVKKMCDTWCTLTFMVGIKDNYPTLLGGAAVSAGLDV